MSEYVIATDAGDKLHVWQISLSDDAPYTEAARPASRHALGTWKFSIHGHYGVDDENASEKAWAVLVELVLDAFRADKRLGNTVIDSGPPQWVAAEYRQISSHLCHYADRPSRAGAGGAVGRARGEGVGRARGRPAPDRRARVRDHQRAVRGARRGG